MEGKTAFLPGEISERGGDNFESRLKHIGHEKPGASIGLDKKVETQEMIIPTEE